MKIAVVTGASSGMGREFVFQISRFYKKIDEIWVFARRKERLEELKEQSSVPVRIFCGDMKKKQVFKEYKHALSELRPEILMLVNAAGFGKSGTFREILQKEHRIQSEMTELNCVSLVRMTEFSLPYMKRGSRILNLASAAAFCPQYSFAVYAATKSFVLSFSRSLNEELKPCGIVVTAVCPGPVKTEFFEVSGGLSSPLKKLNLASADKVVYKALTDSKKRKPVSVYGGAMNAVRIGTKLIPGGLVLKAEGKLL